MGGVSAIAWVSRTAVSPDVMASAQGPVHV